MPKKKRVVAKQGYATGSTKTVVRRNDTVKSVTKTPIKKKVAQPKTGVHDRTVKVTSVTKKGGLTKTTKKEKVFRDNRVGLKTKKTKTKSPWSMGN